MWYPQKKYFVDKSTIYYDLLNHGKSKLGLSKLEGESGFSEKYLKWLYDPIMKIFNMKWNDENLDIIINFHWLINFLIIWYFTFF